MSDIKIIDVNKNDPYLDAVIPLFVKLYQHMEDTGMLLSLAEKGEEKWRISLDNMVGGRFGILKVALLNNTIIGFIHGVVRYTPDYLGGLKVGYLTHIFVDHEFREKNVGRRLVEELENWFKTKNVHSYELQVLYHNNLGINFWESVGYKKELLQMRKLA